MVTRMNKKRFRIVALVFVGLQLSISIVGSQYASKSDFYPFSKLDMYASFVEPNGFKRASLWLRNSQGELKPLPFLRDLFYLYDLRAIKEEPEDSSLRQRLIKEIISEVNREKKRYSEFIDLVITIDSWDYLSLENLNKPDRQEIIERVILNGESL